MINLLHKAIESNGACPAKQLLDIGCAIDILEYLAFVAVVTAIWVVVLEVMFWWRYER